MHAVSAFPITRIQEIVGASYGVTVADIRSPRRVPKWVLPRHVAMYLAYELAPGVSLPQVARAFARFDHTSVMYAVRKIATALESDQALATQINLLRIAIKEEFAKTPTIREQETKAAIGVAQALAGTMLAAAAATPKAFLKRFPPK
jgi:hypothetical protein